MIGSQESSPPSKDPNYRSSLVRLLGLSLFLWLLYSFLNLEELHARNVKPGTLPYRNPSNEGPAWKRFESP